MTATSHVHHWIIATPNGPYSVGRCACGIERRYSNTYSGDTVDPMRKASARRGSIAAMGMRTEGGQ